MGGSCKDNDIFAVGLETSCGFKVAFYDIYIRTGKEHGKRVLWGGYWIFKI